MMKRVVFGMMIARASSVRCEMTEDDLWQPQSALEPMLDGEALQRIDDYADSVEIDRLLGMKVIQWHSNYNGVLGTQLRKIRAFLEEKGEKDL